MSAGCLYRNPVSRPDGTIGRVGRPAPNHASYGSFATFSDRDGNGWLLQEITTRLPGRIDPVAASFDSAGDLVRAFRRAARRSWRAREARRSGRCELARLICRVHGAGSTLWPNSEMIVDCLHQSLPRHLHHSRPINGEPPTGPRDNFDGHFVRIRVPCPTWPEAAKELSRLLEEKAMPRAIEIGLTPTRSARMAPLLESLSHSCRKYRRLGRFSRLGRLISPLPSIF